MNREEVKKEVFNTLDYFYRTYKLPELNISDKEWDKFLNIVEAHFLVHDLMNDYLHALNIIIVRALNFAHIDNDSFNINHLSKALCDLIVYGISSDEIKAMQEEITTDVKVSNLKK